MRAFRCALRSKLRVEPRAYPIVISVAEVYEQGPVTASFNVLGN